MTIGDLLTLEELDKWIEGLRKGYARPDFFDRLVGSYRVLWAISIQWAPADAIVERVQFTDSVLDVEISGGQRWRLPASWIEGKLTFMRDLGMLEYCPRCTRIHPPEFTCDGKVREWKEDVSESEKE